MASAITRARVACVLAALAAAPLAGCGGGDDDEPESAAATTAAEQPAAGADVQPGNGEGGNGNGNGGGGGNGKGGGPPDEDEGRDSVGMDGVAEPVGVDPAARPVARVVERELGESVNTGQRTVIGASCKADRCRLRYRVDGKGGGVVAGDVETVAARVFEADAAVKRILVYVHHKQNADHKDERAAFYTADCRRGDDGGAACDGTKAAAGKQRNELRRGKLEVDDASKGRGG